MHRNDKGEKLRVGTDNICNVRGLLRKKADRRLRGAAPLRRRRAVRLAGMVSVLLSVALAAAQQADEARTKAAYVFNFGRYLRQPETAEIQNRRSFDICVLGRDEFHGALDRLLETEESGGLPVRRLAVSNGITARSCAIVFVSRLERNRVDQVLAELAGAPVLTVSDMPHFLQHGGMIQLETKARQVRFSVALSPVNKAGLSLSSQLLKVALVVTGLPERKQP